MPREWNGILAFEGQATGDGRWLDANSIIWEDAQAPWPLKFDQEEGDHTAAVVGVITRIWRDGPAIRGEGFLHDDSDDEVTAAAVARIIELLEAEDGPVLGVSIELDSEQVELRVDKATWEQWQAEQEAWMAEEVPEPEDPDVSADGRVVVERFAFDDWLEAVTSARFRGAALVDTPAFADASIGLAAAIALAASLDGSDPFAPPNFGPDGDHDPRLVWQTPQRGEEVGGWGAPLTVTDDGRVYGHATLRSRCHGAYAACLPPPDHGGDLSRFLVGDATGKGIPTGVITLDTTHGVTADGKIKSHDHLADTGRAVVDVNAGFDQYGLWVAGKLRPGVTDRELAALRGSTLSGEWHPIGGKQRLVGILAVNSPGYLIQRRGVAASAGVLYTTGASCCEEQTLEEMVAILWEEREFQRLLEGVK